MEGIHTKTIYDRVLFLVLVLCNYKKIYSLGISEMMLLFFISTQHIRQKKLHYKGEISFGT